MILSAKCVAIITVCFPFISFVSCIFLSWYLHFESSTSTHCMVPNYLPSISASIGGYSPEKYIWRIGIALHCSPRYLFALVYKSYYQSILQSLHLGKQIANVVFALSIIEISSLIGLSYISSTENYGIHEKLFVAFVISSLLYMLLTNIVLRYRLKCSVLELKSMKLKKIFFTTNIVAFFSSLYFFFRHNWYCEPGVYTMFCLCEYIVVLSNMGFHITGYFDFHDYRFMLTNPYDSFRT